jgi:hypothetical protein
MMATTASAGHRLEAVLQLAIERLGSFDVAAGEHGIDLETDQVGGLEPRIEGAQVAQAAQEQSRAGE